MMVMRKEFNFEERHFTFMSLFFLNGCQLFDKDNLVFPFDVFYLLYMERSRKEAEGVTIIF